MDSKIFKINTILRYQNPLKYESYFYNLQNVQIKAKNTSLDYVGYAICFNKFRTTSLNIANKFTPFINEANSWEKWLFHVKRYQSYHDILGIKTSEKDNNFSEDWGLHPFKKIDVNQENIQNVNYLYDPSDVADNNWMNLGNNALYFTVNPNNNPTLL